MLLTKAPVVSKPDVWVDINNTSWHEIYLYDKCDNQARPSGGQNVFIWGSIIEVLTESPVGFSDIGLFYV